MQHTPLVRGEVTPPLAPQGGGPQRKRLSEGVFEDSLGSVRVGVLRGASPGEEATRAHLPAGWAEPADHGFEPGVDGSVQGDGGRGPEPLRLAPAAARPKVPSGGRRVSGRAGVDAVTPRMLTERLRWQRVSLLGAGTRSHHGGDPAPAADKPAGDRERGAGSAEWRAGGRMSSTRLHAPRTSHSMSRLNRATSTGPCGGGGVGRLLGPGQSPVACSDSSPAVER